MVSLKSATTLAILALTIVHIGCDQRDDIKFWDDLLHTPGIQKPLEHYSAFKNIDGMSVLEGAATNPSFLRHLAVHDLGKIFPSMNIGERCKLLEKIKKTIDNFESKQPKMISFSQFS